MVKKFTELAKDLSPFLGKLSTRVVTSILDAAEGPGIDIVSNVVGLGGDTILLYDSGGEPVAEFALTDAGLDAASAAASAGDVIYIPVYTFTGDHILSDGVAYVGSGRDKTIITGKVTIGPATTFNLSVIRSANDSNDLIALEIITYQSPIIYFCDFSATQLGDGDAYGVFVKAGAGQPHFGYCNIVGESAGGNGYGHYQEIET